MEGISILADMAKFLSGNGLGGFAIVIFLILFALPWLIVKHLVKENTALARQLTELHASQAKQLAELHVTHVADVKLALEKLAEGEASSEKMIRVLESLTVGMRRGGGRQ